MSYGHYVSKSVVRGAGLLACVILILALTACAAREGSEGGEDPGTRYADERERLLATCPARAQDFLSWQQDLAERRGLRRPVWENDIVLDPVAKIAQDHLETLPENQRGGVGIDSVNDRIIVQVTRNKDEVLAELRAKVDDPRGVDVEVVRWSEKELAEFASRIGEVPGLDRGAYGYGNANGRVEVEVPGDAAPVRRKISEVVPRCAFTVKDNVPPIRPG